MNCLQKVVRRRCVFYVSGFDPTGAGRYHALYRDEAKRQEAAGGLVLQVGHRQRAADGNSTWTISAADATVEADQATGPHTPAVEIHYEFLRWDDIVRDHWPRGQWTLWWGILTTTAFYLRHGALWRMFCLSWPPALALFLPFLLICMVLIGLPLVALVAFWIVFTFSGHSWIGALAAAALMAGGVAAAKRLEARYGMYWMMRSYAFTADMAQGRVAAIESRLDAHAQRIAARMLDNIDDEVLVVGHSSGAILAVSMLARALKCMAPALASGAQPKLSFLTLGQCLPLLALLPQAVRFREEMACLASAASPRAPVKVDWIDFSAPPDGCCFALCDPIEACGVHIDARPANSPKLLSPRFAHMFEAAAYGRLRLDKFRMHFQYLMASDLEVAYDYFQITAGSQSLRDRFLQHESIEDFEGLRPRLFHKR